MPNLSYKRSFKPLAGALEDRVLLSQAKLALAALVLNRATVGQSYGAAFSATHGDGNYNYTISGKLPAGISLSKTGLLTGTAQRPDSYRFTVKVTDPTVKGRHTASRTFKLLVQSGVPNQARVPANTRHTTSDVLFGNGGPSYQDVIQGQAGDCWLLSSLAITAARDAQAIESMFTDDGITLQSGAKVHDWTVRFYVGGVATYVTVNTNELPTFGGRLINAQDPHGVLWVPLAEQAYSQLPQSVQGLAWYALPVITGNANIVTDWSASGMISGLAAGRLLTVTSLPAGDSGTGTVGQLGIVPTHDYAVLGYDSAQATFTLLNPWGSTGAHGILNLTWDQLSANFDLDGSCV